MDGVEKLLQRKERDEFDLIANGMPKNAPFVNQEAAMGQLGAISAALAPMTIGRQALRAAE